MYGRYLGTYRTGTVPPTYLNDVLRGGDEVERPGKLLPGEKDLNGGLCLVEAGHGRQALDGGAEVLLPHRQLGHLQRQHHA